ncbi:hypothetical protein SUDANB15_02644 [Streptomyces sp. enrichment culture]
MPSAAPETAGAVFLVLTPACWLVIAAIALLDRPGFLAPPRLRGRRRP